MKVLGKEERQPFDENQASFTYVYICKTAQYEQRTLPSDEKYIIAISFIFISKSFIVHHINCFSWHSTSKSLATLEI